MQHILAGGDITLSTVPAGDRIMVGSGMSKENLDFDIHALPHRVCRRTLPLFAEKACNNDEN